MPTFNASNADCFVFTFKEGLLSAIAHDLRIRVTDFQVELDADNDTIKGTFDPRSLRVVGAMVNGADAPGKLSDGDKQKIQENIVNDVLHPAQHPSVAFESEAYREKGDGYQVKGTLTLHGQQKSIVVDVRDTGDRYVAEAVVHQPDFGIKPYSAMLGTLKIKPDVKIHLSVPKP